MSATNLAAARDPISAIPGVTAKDRRDLATQLEKVLQYLQAGWWTLDVLAKRVGASPAGVSARVRDCRKLGWNVVRRKFLLDGPSRVYCYRIEGRREAEPAKRRPRDSEIDALRHELASLREVVERLEKTMGVAK